MHQKHCFYRIILQNKQILNQKKRSYIVYKARNKELHKNLESFKQSGLLESL
jgi:hypothetical protein